MNFKNSCGADTGMSVTFEQVILPANKIPLNQQKQQIPLEKMGGESQEP